MEEIDWRVLLAALFSLSTGCSKPAASVVSNSTQSTSATPRFNSGQTGDVLRIAPGNEPALAPIPLSETLGLVAPRDRSCKSTACFNFIRPFAIKSSSSALSRRSMKSLPFLVFGWRAAFYSRRSVGKSGRARKGRQFPRPGAVHARTDARVAFAIVAPALTHVSLDNTVKTTGTLADLNYQQVLNNLAVFAADPAAMPSFAMINTGLVTVQDQVGGGRNQRLLADAYFRPAGRGIADLVHLSPSQFATNADRELGRQAGQRRRHAPANPLRLPSAIWAGI